MGLFDKLFKRNKEQEEQKQALDDGLKKTKEGFFSKLTKAIAGKDTVDAEVLAQVEDALVGADVGVDGCFFEAFSFVLDKFAVKAMEAAEIGLELTADILEVPKKADFIVD